MTLIDQIVWVNDEEEVYVKGELIETNGKTITTKDLFEDKLVSGKVNIRILCTGLIIQSTVENIFPYDQSHESEIADVSSLRHLNVASFFHVIRSRFKRELSTTRVFSAIVILNLFEITDAKSEINSYHNLDAANMRGHAFSVAKIALEGIDMYNQSIILSGESGSGKSFVSKELLSYICTENVRVKTIAACNVMSVFGSCSTSLCPTSTRSLNFVRVRFKNGTVEGSDSTHLFLERSRVLSRPECESSFLCFYLLLASLMGGPNTITDINLDCRATFRYIDQYQIISSEEARQDLIRQYNELVQDMSRVGLGRDVQLQVLRTLAVIILIGNIEFRTKEGNSKDSSRFASANESDGSECEIDPSCDISVISQYLGVADVNQLLTTKVIQGGRASSFYHVGLSKTQAKANADALASGLYYKLYGWLATTCNLATKFCGESTTFGRRSSGMSASNYIGVLDMCGFENNVENGFEQLCVNLCNEKLYSVFYTEVFASEATLMQNECCPHPLTLGHDNSPCLALLDGENGICRLIDEHCVLSRAGQDDCSLLGIICNQHPKHPNFDCGLLSKRRKVGETHFKVKHFAGTVVYNIWGFMNSNSEKIEVEPMISGSTNDFIITLHGFQVERPGDVVVNAAAVRKASMTGTFVPRNSRRNVKKTKPTVCADIRSSLAAIVAELQTTALQFITCIKPNRTNTPSEFAAPYVMGQLKAHGIVDVLKSNTESYTMNLSWKDFHETLVDGGLYQPKAHVKVKDSLANTIESIKKLCETSLEPHMWFVGSSGRVFLKAGVFDELRRNKNSVCAKSIQRGWRVFRLNSLRHKLVAALAVVKQALINYVLKVRTAKHLAQLEEVARLYSYLLMRWRRRVRIQKRVAAKVCTWLFKRIMWRNNISKLIRSQAKICSFLQTKRLRTKYLQLKRLALICQMYARGRACRKAVAPLLAELRHNIYILKCRQSATKIYGVYRNYMLSKWVGHIFYAVRWGDVFSLERLLGLSSDESSLVPCCLKSSQLVNIRDRTSGYSTMLHMAVESESVEMVSLFLHLDSDLLCYDFFGNSPLGNIPSPPTNIVHGELLALFISKCPDVLMFPDRAGNRFSDHEKYQSNHDLASLPCGSSTLGETLKHLKWLQERALAKARHRESMSKGTTIIPLYDPEDLECRLRDCIPSADNAYVDLNADYDEDEWGDEGSDVSDSDWDGESQYDEENEEGSQLKQQVGDMIFAKSPVRIIQRSLLEKAHPALASNRKRHGQHRHEQGSNDHETDGVVVSLDTLALAVGDASLIGQWDDDHSCGSMGPSDCSLGSLLLASSGPQQTNRGTDKTLSAVTNRPSTTTYPDKSKIKKPDAADPAAKYSVKNDAKYRMLIAKKRSLEKEPILQFFAETRLTGK